MLGLGVAGCYYGFDSYANVMWLSFTWTAGAVY